MPSTTVTFNCARDSANAGSADGHARNASNVAYDAFERNSTGAVLLQHPSVEDHVFRSVSISTSGGIPCCYLVTSVGQQLNRSHSTRTEPEKDAFKRRIVKIGSTKVSLSNGARAVSSSSRQQKSSTPASAALCCDTARESSHCCGLRWPNVLAARPAASYKEAATISAAANNRHGRNCDRRSTTLTKTTSLLVGNGGGGEERARQHREGAKKNKRADSGFELDHRRQYLPDVVRNFDAVRICKQYSLGSASYVNTFGDSDSDRGRGNRADIYNDRGFNRAVGDHDDEQPRQQRDGSYGRRRKDGTARLISSAEASVRGSSSSGTLDPIQRFRPIDEGESAAISTSAGSGTEKDTTSAAVINLKKLTDKLKRTVLPSQSSPASAGERVDADEHSRVADDLFDGIDLKLSKPECRSIVGSYYQRTIPFRSASFSYGRANEDHCPGRYVRRKFGSMKKPESFINSSPKKIDVLTSMASGAGKSPTDDKLTSSISVGGIDSQPAMPLCATVTAVLNAVPVPPPPPPPPPPPSMLIENCRSPQPPKRTKQQRHKHRRKNCVTAGKLCLSEHQNLLSISKVPEEPVQFPSPLRLSDSACQSIPEDESVKQQPDLIPDDNQQRLIEEQQREPDRVVVGRTANTNADADVAAEEVAAIVDNGTDLSSPEDQGGRNGNRPPRWPSRIKLTSQTSEEKEEDPDFPAAKTSKKYLFVRTDSSEAESDQADRRPLSPPALSSAIAKDGRLSPSRYSVCESSDSECRLTTSPQRSLQSPIPYSKRPLRGPYLEMIVNEKNKSPDSNNNNGNKDCRTMADSLLDEECAATHSNYNLQQQQQHQRARNFAEIPRSAADDCPLRRSNTTPPNSSSGAASNKSNRMSPKRKISANLPPFSATIDDSGHEQKHHTQNGVVYHQRTTSSPSQLEYYPNRLTDIVDCAPGQQLQRLLRGSSEQSLAQTPSSSTDLPKPRYCAENYKDTRSHIVVELYDTERSYVESLQTLVTKYLEPLRSPDNVGLVDPSVVQEIFFQVPEIMSYHEQFLEELRIRLEGWNKSKCIGDIFLDTFTKEEVIYSYMVFIGNWKSAKEAIKSTCHAKPAFARFLENMAREHKGKLALDSLLIMPVQRIPRYELLIQSLIKHTETCHPDFNKLIEAQKQMHDLAVRINCTDRDSIELEQLENLIDGLTNLVSSDRTFLRYDLVTMAYGGQGANRKERALFLFNDLLVITSMKRRSSTVKKSSLNNLGRIASSLEANKYKLLMKIPLEHLDIVKIKDENIRRILKDMECLNEDIGTLSQMSKLVSTLHCPHISIEETIREMVIALNKQLSEKHISEAQLCYLELALNTRNSVENIGVFFPKPEKKSTWEEKFYEAKERLTLSGERKHCPEFITSVPIRKTRAGLQFTSASATYNQEDVWVCNSDGYVGQVCVLSLYPEPTVTSCNGICNAKILCVTSVPSHQINSEKGNPEDSSAIFVDSWEDVGSNIPSENYGREIPDIHLDSSSSSDDDDDGANGYPTGPDESTDDQKQSSSDTVDSHDIYGEPTMWLGTEDGSVHIYNCNDSLRVKKNKLKIQQVSAVYSIIYLENHVFVSLANGDINIYNWEAGTGWNINDSITITVGCAAKPVSKMFPVLGKLWCICHNIIKILNTSSLQIEYSFSINGKNSRAITGAAVANLGVWLSIQNSPVLQLVHSVTYDVLAEVDVTSAVTRMLTVCDDIIRQHKAACLRVTSLMSCKDRLWIGTSAGVILTLPLPAVNQNMSKLASSPHITGIPHGHTGHVRFLTAVKCKMHIQKHKPSSKYNKQQKINPEGERMLIISGGDGYEDFRSCGISEIAGREDSTNHLLLWRV